MYIDVRSTAADPYQKECESVFKDVGARWVITKKELPGWPMWIQS